MTRAISSGIFVAGVVASTFGYVAAEQNIGGSEPAFDVASIKQVEVTSPEAYAALVGQLARQLTSNSLTVEPGGRWLVRAATLRSILQSVYAEYSRPGLIVGGPAWVDSLYFEIDARAPNGSTPEDIERMAKRLLADRFKLQVRTVTRPLEVYTLNVVRGDGRLGPGMRPPVECDQKPTFGPNGLPVPGVRPRCGVSLEREGGGQFLTSRAAQISQLVTWLQMRMDRPVVDRTGLTGVFAIRLEMPRLLPAGPADVATGSSDMITAVREQLGLGLLPRTEPTTVLTIERAELPSPN